MSAHRFPKDDGAFVILDQHAVHANDATRRVRISVRHVVMYWPASPTDSTIVIEGRPGATRVAHTCDELDALFIDQRVAPLDLAPSS